MCDTYYSDSGKATQADYYSPPVLDSFLAEAVAFRTLTERGMSGVDLWLGETGTMFSTNQPHLAYSYVNGFM